MVAIWLYIQIGRDLYMYICVYIYIYIYIYIVCVLVVYNNFYVSILGDVMEWQDIILNQDMRKCMWISVDAYIG